MSLASPVVDEAKDEIRWDIAWQIFDEVNEGLDTDLEVDLNCLDTEEACAIAKQAIFDVAQILYDNKVADPVYGV